MVKTTEPQRPDHGTIGKFARRRDYPMSTYGVLVCGRYYRVSPATAASAPGPTLGATDRQGIGDILYCMPLRRAERDS
jgi:hypothetical protein